MYPSLRNHNAAAYRRVGVETLVSAASPHQLVALLFDELMRNLQAARGAMAAGDIPAKGKAIGQCVRVLEEGLKAGLDMQSGGALAATLRELYDGIIIRLTRANLRNDPQLLDEAESLVKPIRDAWTEIGSQYSAPAARLH